MKDELIQMILRKNTYFNKVARIPNLIAYYPFSDTDSTVRDYSGNSLHGTFKGTIDSKANVWEGGYYARFSNGLVDLYSASFLSKFNVNEFTINFFVRPIDWVTGTNQYYIHLYADASNYIRFINSTNTITFGYLKGGTVIAETLGCDCFDTNNFTMLTAVVSSSGSYYRMMVNGEYNPYNSGSVSGTWGGTFGSNTFGIGGYRGSTFVNSLAGDISNVSIFDRALSETEVRSLLAKPLPVLSAIGDSILQYTSRSSWIQGVAQTKGYRVVNHGVTGNSIMGSMATQTAQTANDGASIIIIQLGTNDIDDASITSIYETNVNTLKTTNPSARIYGMGILNKTVDTYRTTNNTRIQQACINAGIPFWNTDGWIDPATDTGDGIHPNDSGALKIKNEILARL